MNGRMKLKATVIINLQKESEDFTKKGCYFFIVFRNENRSGRSL